MKKKTTQLYTSTATQFNISNFCSFTRNSFTFPRSKFNRKAFVNN